MGNCSEGIREWLEEFTENLETVEKLAAANISHDSDPERPTKVPTIKEGTKEAQYLHSLPKKNKITRSARERRLQGLFTEGGLKIQSVPRAEKFDDLSTADHKVLNEGSESRHNHRYSIVVQDFDTQGIQSYPMQNPKLLRRRKRVYGNYLTRLKSHISSYTDNPSKFGKSCEDLSWNHRTFTPHRSETNGIAERAVRRIKEGTSAVLLQVWLG